MYREDSGEIVERFKDNYLPPFPISIESMPALHFYPNGKFLQVSTMGCNFRCEGCVSNVLIGHTNAMSGVLSKIEPGWIINRAKDEKCIGIAFCINEPLASYQSFKGLAGMAKANGLLVGCSTNAYFSEDSLKSLLPVIDFVNVGLKGYSDETYHHCGVRTSAPVFRNLKKLYDSGVHVEAAAVYHHGEEEEIINAAKAVAAVSRDIPFQVMKYVPFDDMSPELEPSAIEAEALCERLRQELNFVYLFNTPGTSSLNTKCPKCGKIVIKRDFADPMGAMILSYSPEARCECGYQVPIVGNINPQRFKETGFLGGYRLTRGYGMIESILRCLGVNDEDTIARIWVDVTKTGYLNDMYYAVNDIELYLKAIEHFARLSGRENEGEELVGYILEKLELIDKLAPGIKRPRVLYIMSHPLFALNASRFENTLVERAGGLSLNRLIGREGMPGISITGEEMVRLDPEIIIVSGLFSGDRSGFNEFYKEKNVDCPAVKEDRIYHIYPSWDFGTPRWILGMMYIANKVRPETFCFDIDKEADWFYRKFYGVPFESVRSKRHFCLTRRSVGSISAVKLNC